MHWHRNQKTFKSALGLDISDGSLELVHCTRDPRGSIIIETYNRGVLTDNTIIHGLIHDSEALSQSLFSLYAQAQIKPDELPVITALPDAQIITKSITINSPSTPTFEELNHIALESAKSFEYPIKNPKTVWKYAPFTNQSGRLVFYTTEKDWISQWSSFFKKHHIKLAAIEMESLALQRSLIPTIKQAETIALLDFGFRTTSLSLYDSAGMTFSHSIELGGLHMTSLIAGNLHISVEEAETYKASGGLHSKAYKEASKIIEQKINQITGQLSLKETVNNSNVKELIITGGGANLPGLKAYLVKLLDTKVRFGILSTAGSKSSNLSRRVDFNTSDEQLYAGATGLALRGIDQFSISEGINFIE